MKSIKPGRGPSAMGAAGSIAAVVFGILWTIFAFALTKDAPFPMVKVIFPLFGVVFVVMGIVQAVYHYKNATGQNRMSIVDVVDAKEEPDPLDRYIRGGTTNPNSGNENSGNREGTEKKFCPYCGSRLEADYEFCPQCGKSL
ncbi:MAG: zinc-ribbon domain-containing protein [Candidatus Pristimantibacillus sp.]